MIKVAVQPLNAQELPSAPLELPEMRVRPFSGKVRDFAEFTEKVDTVVDPDDYTHTKIYRAFHPLMYSLQMVGLHHHRHVDKSKKGLSKPNFSQMYAWSVTATAWLVVIKSTITMRLANGLGPQMITNMIFSLVLLLCTMNCTAFLWSAHNPKSTRKMFLGYSKLQLYGGPYVNQESLKRYAKIGTIAAWIANAINYGIVIFITFFTDVLSILSTDPFTNNPIGSIIVKLGFVGGAFYMSSFFIFGAVVDLFISLLLYNEFRLFGKDFRSRLSEDGAFNGSLENERRRYLLMTRIVESANDCLAIHHGASFTCGIANICLLLYSIIYYPAVSKQLGVAIAYSYWIIGALVDMTISCLSGILVNASVNVPLFTQLFIVIHLLKRRYHRKA